MSEPARAATDATASNNPKSETLYSRRHKEKLEKLDRTPAVKINKNEKDRSPKSPITLKIKRTIHHPYRHVSTPKPKTSNHPESKNARPEGSRKHSSERKKESMEKTRYSSSSLPDEDIEIKKAIEEVLQHSPGYGHQKTPQYEKNVLTFTTMDKNPFFIPPSEVTNTNTEDIPMEAEENPSSAENTLVYQSAENSPLDISGTTNPDSANNVSESASNLKNSETKISSKRESEVNLKNKSDTGIKNFESAYKTLPMPSSVTARVLNFGSNSQTPTSSEEESQTQTKIPPLRQSIFTLPSPIKKATPPQTLLVKRKNQSPPETVEVGNDGEDESDNTEFQKPRKYKKFKTNFVKLLERKAAASIPLSNKYDSLSESEAEPELNTGTTSTIKGKATPNLPIKSSTLKSGTATVKTAPKTAKKSSIPPIVVDGRTDNHATLTSDLKAIIKGKYSVKYTNSTTVIFTEEQEDYESLLGSIKQAEIPHHTYTNKADKTHAFVLRGLANGTEKEAIEEDLIASYEIKPKDIFKMTTKHRPLFLVVTDPVITLDYLNKNVRVVENTRAMPTGTNTRGASQQKMDERAMEEMIGKICQKFLDKIDEQFEKKFEKIEAKLDSFCER
ncbi:unnamed protein product [Psylliodes chrysocephalus]|uniref:Uncharacterized protein n=1 Tax=Psylliodes chrysocephalus TaxID=3402493 RepID=A0A9P0DA77_9CUCU|nr:unnamed protein product [Psylliodes chrysocephala]